MRSEIEADVYYAGAAPDIVAGIDQINVVIPPGSRTGNNVPIRVDVDGFLVAAGGRDRGQLSLSGGMVIAVST